MKTTTKGIVVKCDKDAEPTSFDANDMMLSISTSDEQLMQNRLESLFKMYGDRVEVPNSLVKELLESYGRKSRKAKREERELDAMKAELEEAKCEIAQAKMANTALREALEQAVKQIHYQDEAIHNIMEILKDDYVDEKFTEDERCQLTAALVELTTTAAYASDVADDLKQYFHLE